MPEREMTQRFGVKDDHTLERNPDGDLMRYADHERLLLAERSQREAAERERDAARNQRNAFDRECKRLRADVRAERDSLTAALAEKTRELDEANAWWRDQRDMCNLVLKEADEAKAAAESQATAAREERDMFAAAWQQGINAADMDAFAAAFTARAALGGSHARS